MKYVENLSKLFFQVSDLQPTSYSLVGIEPTGTMVPISNQPRMIPRFMDLEPEMRKDRIREFLQKNAEILDSENFFFACWFDKQMNLQMDVCEDVQDTQDAIYKAIVKDIPKLFVTKDVKQTVEVTIPAPQRAGTMTQQTTYAKITAQKVYENLVQTYINEGR